MKLKELKNDGVFEKKDRFKLKDGFYVEDVDGYNKSKTELSEVELVVDKKGMDKVLYRLLFQHKKDGMNGNLNLTVHESRIKIVETLSSFMSEWLILKKGE